MKKLTAGFLAVCMAAGLMTGCGAPEPEDEGTTVKTEAAKAVSGDTLKAEEEGTADTSGSVDGSCGYVRKRIRPDPHHFQQQ